MELSVDTTGIDMNIQTNLSFYMQLTSFKDDSSKNEILFSSPDSLGLITLHTLAHRMYLEYEYSLTTRTARISKVVPPKPVASDTGNVFDFMEFEQPDFSFDLVGNDTSDNFQRFDTILDGTTSPKESAFDPFEDLGNLSLGKISGKDPFTGLGGLGLGEINESFPAWAVSNESERRASTSDKGTQTDLFPINYLGQPLPSPIYGSPYPAFGSQPSSSTFNRRKFLRASNACDSCRSIKAKCDEKRPCASCKEKGLVCVYRNPPPHTCKGCQQLKTECDRGKPCGPCKERFQSCIYEYQVPPPSSQQPTTSFSQPELPIQTHESGNLPTDTKSINDQIEQGLTALKKIKGTWVTKSPNNQIIPSSELNINSVRSGRRLSSACNGCRKRKMRCSGEKPTCQQCIRLQHPCEYPVSRIKASSRSQDMASQRTFERKSSVEDPTFYRSPSFSPRQNVSPIGSISSVQSDRGQITFKNPFSRRQSRHSPAAGSGYEEIVFYSNSVRSPSQVSASSGRQGPLDKIARAAANAVKAVGACWKCKIMRDKCNPETPCEACVKSSQVLNWKYIGCKRGPLTNEIPRIALCPQSHSSGSNFVGKETWKDVNKYLEQAIAQREEVLMRLGKQFCREPADLDASIFGVTANNSFLLCLTNSGYSTMDTNIPVTLRPLNECILAIIWELDSHSPAAHWLLGSETKDWFFELLTSAGSYQAEQENDQLIAQSLICLRTSLEAHLVKRDGGLNHHTHRNCSIVECKIECMANLDLHLQLFVDELSRVMLKKENLRNKEGWWLSVFYSLCIQSFVRKALMLLFADATAVTSEYLFIAVRLFIASTGTYDPLTRNYASPGKAKEGEPSLLKEFETAQSLLREKWKMGNVKSSGEYLKGLFEIEDIEPDQPISQSQNQMASKQRNNSWPSNGQLTWGLSSNLPSISAISPYTPHRRSSLSSMESAGPASPYTANM